MRRIKILSLLCVFIPLTFRAYSQAPETDDDGKLIEDGFTSINITPPQLGWILPNGELVSEVSTNELTILAERNPLRLAQQIGTVNPPLVPAFIKAHRVDCDQAAEERPQPIYRYAAKLPPAKQAEQAFVFSGRLSENGLAGIKETTPGPEQMNPVWDAMRSNAGQERLSYAAQLPGSSFTFIFAKLFTRKGDLLREGTFLEDHRGAILGREIREADEDHLCDGCSLPTYSDEVRIGLPAMNILSVPTLPYPMVLMDSSTAEGRAIELFTFSKAGQPSHYRKYEYIVTCILGTAEEQAKPTP